MGVLGKVKSAVKSVRTKAATKAATKVAKTVANNNSNNRKYNAVQKPSTTTSRKAVTTPTTTTKTTAPITIKPVVTPASVTKQNQYVSAALQNSVRSSNAVMTNPTNTKTSNTKTSNTKTTTSGSNLRNNFNNRVSAAQNISNVQSALRNAATNKTNVTNANQNNTNTKAPLTRATLNLLKATPTGQVSTNFVNAVRTGLNNVKINANTNGRASTQAQYDYTKQNVNGSPKVKEDNYNIYYKDGSVYNKQTGKTTTKDGIQLKNSGQATQVTEGFSRGNANAKSNNASQLNGTTYNPTATSKNVTTDRKNQAAAGTVIKVGDTHGNITGVKSKDLGSKEKTFYNEETGTVTYTAPNGKVYTLVADENGNIAFNSQGGESKGSYVNLQDGEGNAINDPKAIIDYIRSQNDVDWINRGNVDNSRAIKGALIEGTYTAPSGKEYDIVEGQGVHEGQVGFVNYKGQVEYFDSWNAAKAKIDQNNPVWSTDTSKNPIAPELSQRGYVDENGDAITEIDAIDNANEEIEGDKKYSKEELEAAVAEALAKQERAENESDEIYETKKNIINQSFADLQNFQTQMEDALSDLEEKTKLVQDNDRMRRARQRAAQLAAQGYLTSEQVAQVANYSIADYNKELEASANEAAKAMSELKVQIAQKEQEYLQAIRNTQYTNENERQAQLNYATEVFTKLKEREEGLNTQYNQFYTGLKQNNLSMAAQNELGYDSIIRQDEANKVVDDRNLLSALTNSVDRKKYILSQVQDVNLHPYVEKIINYLQSQGKFLIRNGSSEQMKANLAKQISGIIAAAKQAQIDDQKSLAS